MDQALARAVHGQPIPPPDLARSAPREVRLTRAGRALVALAWLFGVAAFAGGLAVQTAVRRQAHEALLLQQNGIEGRAVIERLWRKKSDGKPAFAAYHFDAGGTRVNGEARMQLEPWRALQTGSVVPVRFDSGNPHRHVLAGARVRTPPPGLPAFLAGALFAAAALCAFAIRRQRALLMDGRPAPARITKFAQHKSSHGATHRTITYEFPLFGGGSAKGKASVGKNAGAVGASIWIVYDPERPRRSRPYPFSLVTLDTGERA